MNRVSGADKPRAGEPMGARKHNGMDHQASAEEIERDLARTRADLNDTLSAIEHRLSPGELVDQTIDYLRGGPREFAINLGEQARDNPMPVALMAIGLGWLMFGPRPREHYRQPYEEYTSEGLAEKTYGRTAESVQQMGEAAARKKEELREGIAKASGTMRHRARVMASGMRRGSEEMASGIRQTGEKARGTFSYLLREQPLVLGALGVALGAIMGTGLPTTAREREKLGPTRDVAVSRAQEMGREQMEKTREELKQAISESTTVHSGTPQ